MLLVGYTPNDDWHWAAAFSIIGVSFFGMGTGIVALPIMPEILEAVEEDAENKQINFNARLLENHCSSYFIMQ